MSHEQGLGGTAVVFRALEEGSIDVYPEYTGTLAEAVLHTRRPGATWRAFAARSRAAGIEISRSARLRQHLRPRGLRRARRPDATSRRSPISRRRPTCDSA